MLLPLLALGLLSCRKEEAPPRSLKVVGILPLSGIFSADGKAFRLGLEQGLEDGRPDSLRIAFEVLDNASSVDSSHALLARIPPCRWLVAGIGPAVSDLPAPSGARGVWVGEGTPADSQWLRVSTGAGSAADSLISWYRRVPKPVAVLFPASGAWAPAIQEHLARAADSLVLIPHDAGEQDWSREVERLWTRRPRSVLLWNSPEEARSLMRHPDLRRLWKKVSVLGPLGSGTREAWGPVWDPSLSPDSLELAHWQALGRRVGRMVLGAEQGRRPARQEWEVPLEIAPSP
jgi:hypothetical protein